MGGGTYWYVSFKRPTWWRSCDGLSIRCPCGGDLGRKPEVTGGKQWVWLRALVRRGGIAAIAGVGVTRVDLWYHVAGCDCQRNDFGRRLVARAAAEPWGVAEARVEVR